MKDSSLLDQSQSPARAACSCRWRSKQVPFPGRIRVRSHDYSHYAQAATTRTLRNRFPSYCGTLRSRPRVYGYVSADLLRLCLQRLDGTAATQIVELCAGGWAALGGCPDSSSSANTTMVSAAIGGACATLVLVVILVLVIRRRRRLVRLQKQVENVGVQLGEVDPAPAGPPKQPPAQVCGACRQQAVSSPRRPAAPTTHSLPVSSTTTPTKWPRASPPRHKHALARPGTSPRVATGPHRDHGRRHTRTQPTASRELRRRSLASRRSQPRI